MTAFIFTLWPELSHRFLKTVSRCNNNILATMKENYETKNEVDSKKRFASKLKLTIVGDGWDLLKAQLQHESEFNNFDASGIIFTGRVSDSSMMKLLESHVLFVSPIIGSTGINTKNLLALEAGIPLITTSLGAEGIVFEDINLEIPKQGDKMKNRPTTNTSFAPFLIADEASVIISSILYLYSDYCNNIFKTSPSKHPLLVESISILDDSSFANHKTFLSAFTWQQMAIESEIYISQHFNQLEQIKDLIDSGM